MLGEHNNAKQRNSLVFGGVDTAAVKNSAWLDS